MLTMAVKVTGTRPLLQHNIQLADPTNKFNIAISKIAQQRKKTEAQYLELRKLEWTGGLYLDTDGRIVMPGENIVKAAIEGGRISKKGKELEAGLLEAEPTFPLEYDGPKKLEALYEDPRFSDYRAVRVGTSRTMRCRPRFGAWHFIAKFLVDESIVNPDVVMLALTIAGERKGIGDRRPRCGTFTVARLK